VEDSSNNVTIYILELPPKLITVVSGLGLQVRGPVAAVVVFLQ
jgi:hypothetical protein